MELDVGTQIGGAPEAPILLLNFSSLGTGLLAAESVSYLRQACLIVTWLLTQLLKHFELVRLNDSTAELLAGQTLAHHPQVQTRLSMSRGGHHFRARRLSYKSPQLITPFGEPDSTESQ